MRAKVRVTMECRDVKTANKLMTVLSPDNRVFPNDQRFTSELKGSKLVFQAESERPLSVVTSIESLLSDVGLFQEIWLLSS